MESSTLHQTHVFLQSARQTASFALFLLVAVSACKAPQELPVEPVAEVSDPSCDAHSSVRATIDGSISADIRWDANQMRCESMLRPDNDGPRLRFSGTSGEGVIAIILALPGLDATQNDVEVPTNVTVSVEGSGRFFSTPNLQTCWTEVQKHERLADSDERYEIAGTLFCVAALGELNGKNFIDISHLNFSSSVDWSTQ